LNGRAPILYDAALRRAHLCQALPALRASGSPYHIGWVVLQLLGTISALACERAYIVAHLRALAAERATSSVLIAGCADCGLLSVLHEAFGADAGRLSLHIADRAPAPLALCRRYAALAGLRIDCEAIDLADPPAARAAPVDLVLAHSILSFVAPPARAGLLANLGARLAPGGSLLLYQSVRADHGAGPLAYSAQQADQLVGAALAARGDPVHGLASLEAGELERIVRDFCGAKITHAVRSEHALYAGARAAGLDRVRCTALFDDAMAAHRPATPASRYVKWMLNARRA
jgi:SAM-dependent methyltransferase